MPAAKKKSPKDGIVHLDLSLATAQPETVYQRADLVFSGVDHSDMSYEVRVFLNNRKADETTERTAENGYAGKFVVFGHGRCFGDVGHCDVAPPPHEAFARDRMHPVTPQKKIVTITKALGRLASEGLDLKSVTLVPVSNNPRRKDRQLTADLFKCQNVQLQTYR